MPDVLIKKALLTIPGDDYLQMLEAVLTKKARTVIERDNFKRNYKLQNYAVSRGFEADLIADLLKSNDL